MAQLIQPPENQRRAVVAVHNYWAIARRTYSLPDIPPQVKFNLRGKVAGWAHRQPLEIRLNVDLLEREPEYMIGQTVPHEVAHCVCYAVYSNCKPHGREWRNVMHQFGVEPKRCHNLATTPARVHVKYRYECRCDGKVHELGAKRNRNCQSGRVVYRCRTCRGILVPVDAT